MLRLWETNPICRGSHGKERGVPQECFLGMFGVSVANVVAEAARGSQAGREGGVTGIAHTHSTGWGQVRLSVPGVHYLPLNPHNRLPKEAPVREAI